MTPLKELSLAESEIATNTSRSIIAQPVKIKFFHSWEINKTIVYQVTRENSGVDISSTRLFIDGTESLPCL